MNVLVNRRQGDCGYTLLDPRVDLFRAGMARHRLHDFIENLALVGRRDPMILAKFTKGTGLDVGRRPHEELVNDNFYCSVKRQPLSLVFPIKSETNRYYSDCLEGHRYQETGFSEAIS